RLQDRVAADVVQAYAQGQGAASRVREAESGLKDALLSATENLKSVSEPKQVGLLAIPIIRPQEATAAIQALVKAYFDYYGAVAAFNRAQFRLYRALGQPAQLILEGGLVPCAALPANEAKSLETAGSNEAPQVRPTIERAAVP